MPPILLTPPQFHPRVHRLEPGQEVVKAVELRQKSNFGAVRPDQEEAHLATVGPDGLDFFGPDGAPPQDADKLDGPILGIA